MQVKTRSRKRVTVSMVTVIPRRPRPNEPTQLNMFRRGLRLPDLAKLTPLPDDAPVA